MELGQGEPLALPRRRQAIAGELADLLAADPQQLHRPGQPRLVGPEADAVELLRVGREQIRELTRYGLAPMEEGEGLALPEQMGRASWRGRGGVAVAAETSESERGGGRRAT